MPTPCNLYNLDSQSTAFQSIHIKSTSIHLNNLQVHFQVPTSSKSTFPLHDLHTHSVSTRPSTIDISFLTTHPTHHPKLTTLQANHRQSSTIPPPKWLPTPRQPFPPPLPPPPRRASPRHVPVLSPPSPRTGPQPPRCGRLMAPSCAPSIFN